MIAAVYDWSGFYIGANGGWGSSHKCWDSCAFGVGPKVAMTRPAARSVARSAIAGRPAPVCSASKRRATGPTSRAATSACVVPGHPQPARSRRVRPVHRPGRLRRQQRPVLRQGRCGCDRRTRYRRQQRSGSALAGVTSDDTRWGGTVGVGLEYGFAPNWSVGVEYDHLFMQDRTYTFTTPAGAFFGTDRIRQDVDLVTARLNYRFGGPDLAVLISRDSRETSKPRALPGAFLVCRACGSPSRYHERSAAGCMWVSVKSVERSWADEQNRIEALPTRASGQCKVSDQGEARDPGSC